MIPTQELGKSPVKRRRAGINELQNLKYLPRSTMERELLIEDRTPAHADHVGFGPDRLTTAAVGKTIIVYPMIESYYTQAGKVFLLLSDLFENF